MSIQAQVVWLEAPGKIAFRTETVASPGATQLRCETVSTIISPGTELAAWRGLPPLRPGTTYPRLQGYCNVARVVEVGKNVDDYSVGDRVLSLSSHRSGMTLDQSDVYYRLGEEEDAEAIASSYLYHLGYNACLRSGVKAGSRVLVVGIGALGLTSIAIASLAGAEIVALTDHAQSSAMAKQAGAGMVLSRAEIEMIASAFAGKGPDVIILTTNSWSDFEAALVGAAQNAIIACLGFPGREVGAPSFNPLESRYFYNKQLRIEAVGFSPLENDARNFARFNLRDNIGFIARQITSGRLDPSMIVSGRYASTDIEQAYRDLDARKNGAITYALDWT